MFIMNTASSYAGYNPNKASYYPYNKITQQIKMNDPSSKNGIIDVWYNGVYSINFTEIQYRTVSTLGVRGIEFSTFFGGGTSNYATPGTPILLATRIYIYKNRVFLSVQLCIYKPN